MFFHIHTIFIITDYESLLYMLGVGRYGRYTRV